MKQVWKAGGTGLGNKFEEQVERVWGAVLLVGWLVDGMVVSCVELAISVHFFCFTHW